MKTHYIIILAIAILAGVWTAGVVTGAAHQDKKRDAEIEALKEQIDDLRDRDLAHRINIANIQFDVEKMKQATK